MRTDLDRLAAALAGRYRVERELGQGGMATVYLAQDLRHPRKVAIKVLRPELAAVIGAERFVREIQTIAALQHPHILGLIDSGAAAEGHESGADFATLVYYVMPYVEGESLRARLTREKQLPVADALRVAAEVAAAVDYAHRHGVIHRDIKPENILFQDGQALVADFGIALDTIRPGRMTLTGMSLGTPHYMSPEQAMAEREITPRSDVYSLGCVVYEMLLGEPPFVGPTSQAILARIMTEKPASLRARRETVPAAVEQAVLTALQKLPADRFASAAAFSSALAGPSSEASGAAPAAGSTVKPGGYRLSEDTCRRLARASFDPRLVGTEMHYLDNGVPSELLVCFIPACGRGADQYLQVLETASYRAVAPTFRGFEPVSAWRPSLSLDDHMVLVREFLRDLGVRIHSRFTVIAGFSSGADFALRFAARPDPDARLRVDGCLALGANLSIQTCFLTSQLAQLENDDDRSMLAILRSVTDAATSLDEWVNICDYVVRVVPTFRRDVAPLRAFGADISAPFAQGPITPLAEWYRAAAARGCRLRCVFEDTPMYRDLVRNLQIRNLDEGLLGPHYEDESLVSQARTTHFDLIDPARVEGHVQALWRRLRDPS